MSTSHIVSLLIEERSRLEAAITVLQGSTGPMNDEPTALVLPKAKVPAAPKKKGISEEARRRMVEGQKKRWAKINAAKAKAATPKKRTKAAVIAEAIAPPEDEEFKSKMSEAMKASWAKRKKATAAAGVKRKAASAKTSVPAKKGGLTEAGRKALSIAMKKRWAAKKKAAEKKAA
jgi:hypothetical protein